MASPQGDVLKVLVKVGDTLAVDQPVLELETDKATIEVPSNVAGTVKEIKVKAGDKVKTGPGRAGRRQRRWCRRRRRMQRRRQGGAGAKAAPAPARHSRHRGTAGTAGTRGTAGT